MLNGMPTDPTTIVLAYLEAFEQKDFERVASLLDPDLEFTGPGGSTRGSPAYIAAIQRLSPILLRNDVKKTFADGDDVCVVYDFVTDTPAGALLTMEWHTVKNGRIRVLRLLFDRVSFRPVVEELARRTNAG